MEVNNSHAACVQSHQLRYISDQHPRWYRRSTHILAWMPESYMPYCCAPALLVYDDKLTVFAFLCTTPCIILYDDHKPLQCISDTNMYTLIAQVQASQTRAATSATLAAHCNLARKQNAA